MKKKTACIILAAGSGSRMKSQIPKVLHPLCGREMLGYVLDLAAGLKFERTVAVLGRQYAEVKKYLSPGVIAVEQKRLLGTADAVKTGLAKLKSFKGTVLVLYADNPLLKEETIRKLLAHHQENNLDATLLTAQVDKPEGYGRVLRDRYSSICAIREDKDCDEFQKAIREINTGIMCFDKAQLQDALRQIKPDNRKKEYYLTDAISIIFKKGGLTAGVNLSDITEALGVNSRKDLASANKIMQKRINEKLMLGGVSITDPDSTFIGYGVKIGQDSVIYPFTVIENGVKIGKRCSIGPFAHLRQGSEIKDDVVAGNFLEIVRTKISSKTWAKHFCYLGDSRIGKEANIGAGTVVANFDGKDKHTTVIGDKAFIGSDSILVAPVVIGKGAKTGAGSVVLKNVPGGKVAVGVPAKLLKSKG